MATAYKRADGTIGFRVNALEAFFFPLPSDVVDSVNFDETTNAAVVADIRANPTPYALVTGVLKKNGANVVLAADGDRAALLNSAATAVSNNNTFLGVASPTNAQVLAQVKALTQQNNQIIRRLVQLTQ